MVKTIISVDPKKAPWEQDTPLHNRWHPDIPPVASVKQGDKFRKYDFQSDVRYEYGVLTKFILLLLLLILRVSLPAAFSSLTGVECVDWTGGQIKNNDSSDDVKNVDLSQVHYLSGPITVEGAQPGDLLKVEFLNLGPLDYDEWVSFSCSR